ncbi:MAG: protein kinase [Gemmataceae bacterium]|nr:protein kinase [Gemmataceae bacterium]MCI0739501.1 protein kinase [Gemmataceae bacterium]
MPWQFRITNGADEGRVYALNTTGVTTIGSSRRHADISLNDIYVARVHCEVEVTDERVVLTAHETPSGTLVNNQKARQQELFDGDVLRMGNSEMCLERIETVEEVIEDVPEIEVEVLAEDEAPAESAEAATEVEEAIELADEAAEETVEEAIPASHRPEELAGQAYAHFQVEQVVAKGQCGVVFRARNQKTNDIVALKVFAADFPQNEAEMQRFVQTWKSVLPLRHPHLVSLTSAGRTGPFCWLAYEFVEHVPLVDIFERSRKSAQIDWRRGFRVAEHISKALAFAHQHDWTHRNITARHILYRSSDKVAKLADLGLAAALHGSDLRKITMRDKVAAELVFLTPEQTHTGHFTVGACDIYSLGVVVYALLTGRFPCAGDTQADIIRHIRETPPVPPSKLQPAIPQRLEAIVLRMLAKQKEDRYQTPQELLVDLQAVGAAETAPA